MASRPPPAPRRPLHALGSWSWLITKTQETSQLGRNWDQRICAKNMKPPGVISRRSLKEIRIRKFALRALRLGLKTAEIHESRADWTDSEMQAGRQAGGQAGDVVSCLLAARTMSDKAACLSEGPMPIWRMTLFQSPSGPLSLAPHCINRYFVKWDTSTRLRLARSGLGRGPLPLLLILIYRATAATCEN